MRRILTTTLAGLWLVAGAANAEPNDGLESAIGMLAGSVASPSACEDPPTPGCESAVTGASKDLDAALEALNPPPPPPNRTPPRDAKLAEKALGKAATAVKRLEKAELDHGAIGQHIFALVAAAFERVDEAEDDAEEEIDSLCSSRRLTVTKKLRSPERYLEKAENEATSALRLQRLRSALKGFDAADKSAETSQAKCRPRACRGEDLAVFTAGNPSNESLALIPPDKGTVLDYDYVATDLDDADMSGDVRLTYRSLSSINLESELEIVIPFLAINDLLEVTGTIGFKACSDAQGWRRLSSLSERVRLYLQALDEGGRSSMSVLSKPVTPGLFSTLFPVNAGALQLRVGDRVEQSNVEITEKNSGEPSEKSRCSIVHQVAAIEDVLVGTESLPTARIETAISCVDSATGEAYPPISITTWMASRLGQVRTQVRGDEEIDLDLSCYEEPGKDSEGRCGAF